MKGHAGQLIFRSHVYVKILEKVLGRQSSREETPRGASVIRPVVLRAEASG